MQTPDPAPGGIRTVRKRARTGCIKCRARRRKCDEEKPVCQNCVSKGFECHYGVNLTYRNTNAHTLSLRDVASPHQTSSYTSITFVHDAQPQSVHEQQRSNATRSKASSDIDARSDTNLSLKTTERSTEPNIANEQLDQAPTNLQSSPRQTVGNDEQHLGLRTFSTISTPRLSALPTAFEDTYVAQRDQHGGSQDRAQVVEGGTLERFNGDVVHNLSGSIFNAIHEERNEAPIVQTLNSGKSRFEDRINIKMVSEEQILGLIRHYRYRIAPWLDICDSGQQFGNVLPSLAMEDVPLLSSLLDLSAQHFSLVQSQDSRDFLVPGELPETRNNVQDDQIYAGDKTSAYVKNLFHILLGFLRSPFEPATNQAREALQLANTAFAKSFDDEIVAATFWCSLRIGIGVLLGSDEDMTIMEHLSCLEITAPKPVDQVLSPSLSVDQYANYALVLCARVLKLQGYIESGNRFRPVGPGNSSLLWQELWNDLSLWEKRRPRVLRPILEMPGVKDSHDLGTILFSTGTALFCNQIYHTSLLLMLRCKPRTLKVASSSLYPPNSTSLLWHAHRICSIAVDNISAETWDPALVTSLLLASEYITHRGQQQAVMNMIRDIAKLTGWALESKAAKLNQEWSLADVT